MRVAFRSMAAACFFSLGASQASSAQSVFSGIGQAQDGDSLVVGNREVRLFGIDAPEWDQTCKRDGREWACGQAAAAELANLVTGKTVNCVQMDIDQYGRAVAECAVGSVNLNRTMVALGYAVAYRRYSNAYVSAEQAAKADQRGIWAGTFELPGLFRREERSGQRNRPQHVSHRKHPRSVPASTATATASTDCVIKGNRGSHGWIYHLPGMPYYNATHAEEWFCTEAQAQAAGYRRARAR